MTRKKYKKKDKLKLINPYVAKQGTPSCKEERGKFAIIKEYIKKHPISFAMIVGVLSSLITIYQFWISPEDKVRNKIESHVCVIRDTFNCEDINEKGKVNQDLELIKDFQHAAISFVNYWKAVEAITPLEKSKGFEDAEANYRNMYLERERDSQVNKYRMLYYSFFEMKNKIFAIIHYGQKHRIYEYVYSADRWNNIRKDLDIIDRTVKDTKEQVKRRWTKIESKRESFDNLSAKELSYVTEPYYKMFDTMETLVIVEEFLSYIIDLNASCLNHLTKEMIFEKSSNTGDYRTHKVLCK